MFDFLVSTDLTEVKRPSKNPVGHFKCGSYSSYPQAWETWILNHKGLQFELKSDNLC